MEQNVEIGRGFGGETDSFWRCAMSLWVGGRAAQDLQIRKRLLWIQKLLQFGTVSGISPGSFVGNVSKQNL